MSLLLHFITKLVFFSVLTVVVLALLTWLTKKPKGDPNQQPPVSGEYPEDKLTYVDRISAKHPYSASRRDLKDEQDRRRA